MSLEQFEKELREQIAERDYWASQLKNGSLLTIKMLENIKHGTIFKSGEAQDAPNELNMAHTGKLLRWVAVRGHGPLDWAIYCHFADKSEEWIKNHGDKVHWPDNICRLVPCDEEALKCYRN